MLMRFRKKICFRLCKAQFILMRIIFNVVLDISFPSYPDFFLTYHLLCISFCPSSVDTDNNVVPGSETTGNGTNVVIFGITLKLLVV